MSYVGKFPPPSSVVTSAFGSISAGTAKQNTLGYSILVSFTVLVTAAVGGSISVGIGSTSTPSTNPLTGGLSLATSFSFNQIVPAGYYILVTTSGTITIGSITTQACAVGV